MKKHELLAGLLAAALCTVGARAQSTLDHPVGRMLPYLHATPRMDNPAPNVVPIDAFQVHMQNAAWIRVYFDIAALPPGSYVQLTSMRDGESQTLDAESMDMWSYGSAYFNGDTVIVEVFAGPNTRGTFVNVKEIAAEFNIQTVGDPGECGICGSDNRSQTAVAWTGRLMPVGCTGSMYCSGDGMITAGHCVDGRDALVMQFNVPNSSTRCATVAPPVNDQFPVLPDMQFQNAGEGADWAVCRVGFNALGQTPVQRYGQFRTIAPGPLPANFPANIWGYGEDETCARSQTQQYSPGNITQIVGTTHYLFNNDVRAGNSGSGYLNASNQIIGVVTHCRVDCPNTATRIDLPAFVAARNAIGCGLPPVPVNDNCANPTVIGLGSVSGYTTGATNDGFAHCLTSDSPDVWYFFRPTCGGTYRLTTCGGTTSFNTVLSVHTGCPGNLSNTVACNDDDLSCSASTRHSTINVVMNAGTSYYIRVGAWSPFEFGLFTLTLSAVTLDAAPFNNSCSNATVIGVGSITGSITCATHDGATNCSTQVANDVWYRFTPTCSGSYRLSTCGGTTNINTVLSVHTACPGNVANQIACNDNDFGCSGGFPLSSTLTVMMNAGTTYRIRVSGGFPTDSGNFTLTLASVTTDAPPTNDSCGSATTIGMGSITGSTYCATMDGTTTCGALLGSDVWYRFTPTCRGTYRLTTCGGTTNFDTVLSVHTGCPGNGANTIACNDDSPCFDSGLRSTIEVELNGGTNYYIRIGSFGETVFGDFTLTVSAVSLDAPPFNDSCANATEVGVGSIDGSTSCSTNDGANNCGIQGANDVWYRFTPTCSGSYRLTTCGGTTNFDTVLSVHTGCPGNMANTVACDDDDFSCSASSAHSTLVVALTADTNYYIRVSSYFAGATGNFTLTTSPVTLNAPSANNACLNATAVGTGTVFGSTRCATNDGSTSCNVSTTSPDVWYVFTPDCTAFYDINTVGNSDYDTALSVHTGCPGNVANQIACNDDYGTGVLSRVSVQLIAGIPYFIRVHGYNDIPGNFQLNLSALPDINDSCSRIIQVSDGTTGFSTFGATTDGLPDELCGDVANDQQVNQDVWFYYVATCDGQVRVDTCGSGYDTKLAVYASYSCPTVTPPVGCNNDACGTQSMVTFNALAGQSFQIRVGGYQGNTGCGVLNILCTPGEGCPGCAADFNQDGGIDGVDVGAFFAFWETGEPCGDVNQDGGIDGADVDYFFAVWENGGC